ncbi:1-acyl-sn-glycerol-3-phosphate acyltransferase [Flavobacterium sp. RSP46]|uniref:lysophospholipid acyltransferase family protein n=1 Tax=unclassified Flavobacterium TaxID=196869 RepID=UPI000F83124F|nr:MULTISPECIES: lysophospholipid acyltransferase family protein [unclassified Flavobacterium]RTY86147.1 1-acyl-sn-glycerol-3-phosphate acyltransferase [Flavobacterium sp. RSP15]RTY89919.1 1-acyl-sn-glycerol-3-phosphate acyltransferase [Flavobacterium sp. RSP46]
MGSFFLGLARLLIFIGFVSFFSIVFYLSSFFRSNEINAKKALVLRDFIIRTSNTLLGIRTIIYGDKPKVQGLIVANHRSYFDPIVIVNQIHAFPVGKKEVASWPMIGYICKISGVLFVDRKCPKSRQETAENIREVLAKGYSIINFPEGTTADLPTTLDFNYGSFVMATKIKAAVIPIAIDYKEKTDAFIGDDTFIPHFLKCFGKRTTEIKITYFPPIYSEDAACLLSTSKKMIDNELIRYRKDWDNQN